MLGETSSQDAYLANWTRSCDTCQAAACTLYCHTDSAYLCNRCDKCIHSTNSWKHEHVWVCTACENAPAALFCQADAAFLCVLCDVQIHSANPLARRHNRVLILPFSGASSTCDLEEMQGPAVETENEITACKSNEEQDETDEIEEYLDLSEYNSCKEYKGLDLHNQEQLPSQVDNNSDSVVPVQSSEINEQHQQNICNSEDIETDKVACSGATSSQRVTMPFVNADFLVEATSEISNSRPAILRGSNYCFPQPLLPMPLLFNPTGREARVLRYREKRKARTFQKKIRYASRKANAETRPRVKGRFVRKTDTEYEENQMIANEDYGYGIVPSY